MINVGALELFCYELRDDLRQRQNEWRQKCHGGGSVGEEEQRRQMEEQGALNERYKNAKLELQRARAAVKRGGRGGGVEGEKGGVAAVGNMVRKFVVSAHQHVEGVVRDMNIREMVMGGEKFVALKCNLMALTLPWDMLAGDLVFKVRGRLEETLCFFLNVFVFCSMSFIFCFFFVFFVFVLFFFKI